MLCGGTTNDVRRGSLGGRFTLHVLAVDMNGATSRPVDLPLPFAGEFTTPYARALKPWGIRILSTGCCLETY